MTDPNTRSSCKGYVRIRNTFLEYCEYPEEGGCGQTMRRSRSFNVLLKDDLASHVPDHGDSTSDLPATASPHPSQGPQPLGNAQPSAEQQATTVMLRNVACRYMPGDVAAILDEAGLRGTYNFVYLPKSKRKDKEYCKGYVFVDFKHAADVDNGRRVLSGLRFGNANTTKVVEVALARQQRAEMLKVLARHQENSLIVDPGFADDVRVLQQRRRRTRRQKELAVAEKLANNPVGPT